MLIHIQSCVHLPQLFCSNVQVPIDGSMGTLQDGEFSPCSCKCFTIKFLLRNGQILLWLLIGNRYKKTWAFILTNIHLQKNKNKKIKQVTDRWGVKQKYQNLQYLEWQLEAGSPCQNGQLHSRNKQIQKTGFGPYSLFSLSW